MLRRTGQRSPMCCCASVLLLPVANARLSHAAVLSSRRPFFPPGTPGKDFLRHLTSPSEPTKAFSPLDTLRPPAPPSASDAQPFGSLNRTNHLRRYVNVNTAPSVAAAASGATKERDSSRSSSSTPKPSRSSGSDVVADAAATPSPVPPSPMDLSRLVRRHASCPTNATAATSAPALNASVGATSSLTSQHPAGSPSDMAQGGVGAAAAAAATTVQHASAATSTHATVAKAQAAIAAAQKEDNKKAKRSQHQQTNGTTSASSAQRIGAAGGPRGAASTSAHRDHKGNTTTHARQHSQVYKEHCTIGWSPEEFYQVVADVEHYTDFLPWCAGSEVHTTRRVRVPRGRRLLPGNSSPVYGTAAGSSVSAATVSSASCSSRDVHRGTSAAAAAAEEEDLVDAIEMTATLTIGFSFLKEQYTSRVTLYPGTKIVAALYDDEDADATAAATAAMKGSSSSQALRAAPKAAQHDSFVVALFKKAASTAGAAAKRSILKHLLCEWEFCPVPGKPNTVEVVFSVSFEFKNPLHSHMIMSNVVTLMTRSFERRCESLYGPPSATKESLPLLF